MYQTIGWASIVLLAAALSACGGGGGDSSGVQTSNTSPDESTSGANAATSEESAMRVAVKAGEAEMGASIRPLAASNFGRANTYRIFSASGTEQWLRLDFARSRYEVIDGVERVYEGSTSGSFEEDFTEPGTFIFSSPRLTKPISTARFRIVDGAVIGSFPFARPRSNPVVYEVSPFIAARDFITQANELDGVYNRFGVMQTLSGRHSEVKQLRIRDGGTAMEICALDVIQPIDTCPPAFKRRFALSLVGDVWQGVNTTDPTDQQRFRIARVGAESVMLSTEQASPSEKEAFRVGLLASDFNSPTVQAYGASNSGEWIFFHQINNGGAASIAVDGDGAYDRSRIRTTASPAPAPGIQELLPSYALPISSSGDQPPGYLTRSKTLMLTVGQQGSAGQGDLEISAIYDGPARPQSNGVYKVFAANGTNHWLWVHFDSGRYRLVDHTGKAFAGALRGDTWDLGTFVFDDPRAPYSPFSPAKFRISSNDTLVGSFPFESPYGTSSGYVVQPFIAAHIFATQQIALDNTYNELTRTVSTTGTGVAARVFRIQNGGTELLICSSSSIVAFQDCPKTEMYMVKPGRRSGQWLARNVSNPDAVNDFEFHVAVEGVQAVVLRTTARSTEASFSIAMPTQPYWGSGAVQGPTMPSSWSVAGFTPSGMTQYVIDSNFTQTSRSMSYIQSASPGLRDYHGANGELALAIQGGLTAMVGVDPANLGVLFLGVHN